MSASVDTRGAGVYAGAAGAEESAVSATSWGAIIAGAFVMAAASAVLLALGAGVGLSSVSPWSGSGASATAFTVGAAIWLIVVQWLASALGGYVTGRLRTKWVGVHTQEVFFRDTAHGFVAWSVAAVVTLALLTSSIAAVVGGAARGATNIAASAAAGASQGAASQPGGTGYLVDTLLRPAQPAANASPQETRGEAVRILTNAVATGSLPPADRTYLAQLVAARAGIPQADAEKRVDDVMAQAKAAEDKARAAADQARKAGASLSFFTFFSMLIGAFIAAASAALGGRLRDGV